MKGLWRHPRATDSARELVRHRPVPREAFVADLVDAIPQPRRNWTAAVGAAVAFAGLFLLGCGAGRRQLRILVPIASLERRRCAPEPVQRDQQRPGLPQSRPVRTSTGAAVPADEHISADLNDPNAALELDETTTTPTPPPTSTGGSGGGPFKPPTTQPSSGTGNVSGNTQGNSQGTQNSSSGLPFTGLSLLFPQYYRSGPARPRRTPPPARRVMTSGKNDS